MIHSGRRVTDWRRMLCNRGFAIVSCRALRLQSESVADAAQGVEMRGVIGTALEAFAQPYDEAVDRPSRPINLVAPDSTENLFARHDAARAS
jgi:hypothetical protein